MNARISAGFTLLEMLVALAVLGFLVAGLSQTVRFGVAAWRQDVRIADRKTDLEAVDRTLRRIIGSLAPGEEGAGAPIDGTADHLTGLTQLQVPGSGPTPVRIEAALALSGKRLVLRWRPHHHAQLLGTPSPVQETELVGGVAQLHIAYWQPSGAWVSTWHDPNLPLLIRFRVTFAGNGAPRWPDIVVAPLLSRP